MTEYNNKQALEDRDGVDGRLFSPSAARNKAFIAAALSDVLPDNARVLEIGSGTGEQGIAAITARPDVRWQFSDPDPASRASQSAWMAHENYKGLAPLDIDASRPDWAKLIAPVDCLFSSNVIHISPLTVSEGLAAAAPTLLERGGQVVLYGPFLQGADSAASNLEFDRSLKSRNPAWGVRELHLVKHIFAKHGLACSDMRAMPKNNFLVIFTRD